MMRKMATALKRIASLLSRLMYFDTCALNLIAKCDETILNEIKTHAFNCWTRPLIAKASKFTSHTPFDNV
jgi:hypothetical protein